MFEMGGKTIELKGVQNEEISEGRLRLITGNKLQVMLNEEQIELNQIWAVVVEEKFCDELVVNGPTSARAVERGSLCNLNKSEVTLEPSL